jgi:glucose-1-phosphate adenylyltransferase
VAAIPFGGRYRTIDFSLSNMVNSGINNIVVITQSNYRSLIEHVGMGKEWNLNRKHGGLTVFSPYTSYESHGWYTGTVDALHSIMSYVRKSSERYVVISGTHMVCNINYEEALKSHLDSKADVTMIYKEEKDIPKEKLKKYVLIETDENGRVCDMEINPTVPSSRKICMKMFIMDKKYFEYSIEEAAARGQTDFIKHVLLKNLDSTSIYGFEHKGFLARVDSISTYFRYNMMLLKPEIMHELFYNPGRIYTNIKDEVPAKYTDTAHVKNCLVADGCIVEGHIENCVLFRGVKVYKGACVKNCIIMEETEVQENAVLDHVILDRRVVIKRGRTLVGQENYPVVIGKGEII